MNYTARTKTTTTTTTMTMDAERRDGRRHGCVRVRVRVGGARGRVGALTSAFALASISRAYGQYSPFTTRTDLKTAVDACTGSMVGCTDGNTPPVSIENWDVAAVTDMYSLFSGKSDFNADISGWDVAAVTDMQFMFSRATAFNQDISGWDVSAVTDMEEMFNDATAFNQDISGWNDAALTSYTDMFNSATAWTSLCVRTDGTSSAAGPASAWERAPFSSPFSRRDKLKATINSCLSSDSTGAACVDANNVLIQTWDVSGLTDQRRQMILLEWYFVEDFRIVPYITLLHLVRSTVAFLFWIPLHQEACHKI